MIGLLATLAGGYPIFKEAWDNIRERRMTMELSMTIALVAALLIGEFFTALIITLFVLVAEILEGLTVARGRHASGDLLDLLPRTRVCMQAAREGQFHLDECGFFELEKLSGRANLPTGSSKTSLSRAVHGTDPPS